MNIENLHIGKMIAERLEEVGMRKAEFARRIHTSRQNINTLLNRKSLDVDLLLRIGEVLKFDFLKEISTRYPVAELKDMKENQMFVLVPVSREERKQLIQRMV